MASRGDVINVVFLGVFNDCPPWFAYIYLRGYLRTGIGGRLARFVHYVVGLVSGLAVPALELGPIVVEGDSGFLGPRPERSVVALDALVTSERVNAILGWLMTGIVALGAAESFLTNALLWGGFSLLLMTVALLPALTTHSWVAMAPWPLLSLAAISVIAKAAEIYPETAGYLAIATLALLVVVELDVFTPVELGRRFAVGFGVLTAMAIEALWIVAQFYSDRWLGTEFLTSQTELQEEIVTVTVVGLAVGGIFYWYFDRFEPAGAVDRPSDSAGTR